MSTVKTGLVVLTLALEGMCRTIRAYRPVMNTAIDAAVSAGHISSASASQAKAFLDGVQLNCDIFRAITGY